MHKQKLIVVGMLLMIGMMSFESTANSLFVYTPTEAEYGVVIDFTDDHDQPSEYPEALPLLEDIRQSGSYWIGGEAIADVYDTQTFWNDMKMRGIPVLAICSQYVWDSRITVNDFISRVTSLTQLCPDLPAFEIGNEPEQTWWFEGPLTPQEYMQYLTQAVPIIKSANPNAIIVGPAVSCNSIGVNFLQAIKNLGAFDYLDVISLHYYIYWWNTETALNQLKSIVGGCKPIWITETGWNSVHQSGGESAQNTYLQDYLNPTDGYLKADNQIDKVFYYCLNDAEYPVTSPDEGWGLTYGPERDYMTKQAYATFKQYVSMSTPRTVTLTVGFAFNGLGSTELDGGSYSLVEGTVVSIRAIPDSGYNFSCWIVSNSGEGGQCLEYDNPLQLPVAMPTYIAPIFEQTQSALAPTLASTSTTTIPTPTSTPTPTATPPPQIFEKRTDTAKEFRRTTKANHHQQLLRNGERALFEYLRKIH